MLGAAQQNAVLLPDLSYPKECILMADWLAVFIGGGVGSVLRYALSRWLGSSANGFPIGTLVANILACLILGLAWHYFAQKVGVSPAVKSLILVGLCGGFSTFSTFSNETLRLMQAGHFFLASTYVITSLSSCLLVLWTIDQLAKSGS